MLRRPVVSERIRGTRTGSPGRRSYRADRRSSSRIGAFFLIGIQEDRFANLAKIARAFFTIRRVVDTIQRRQKNRHKKNDQQNDDYDFNVGEPTADADSG